MLDGAEECFDCATIFTGTILSGRLLWRYEGLKTITSWLVKAVTLIHSNFNFLPVDGSSELLIIFLDDFPLEKFSYSLIVRQKGLSFVFERTVNTINVKI